MSIEVRSATAADQPAITAMVRRARLNPRQLEWPHFVVAERHGEIVGVAQLRSYPDGTRELSSLCVLPECRGSGLATRMIDTLLAAVDHDVYTVIDRRFEAHFARWGFRPVHPSALPRPLVRVYRTGRVLTTLATLFRARRVRIAPYIRPSSSDT